MKRLKTLRDLQKVADGAELMCDCNQVASEHHLAVPFVTTEHVWLGGGCVSVAFMSNNPDYWIGYRPLYLTSAPVPITSLYFNETKEN
jgi:hypothetical protein